MGDLQLAFHSPVVATLEHRFTPIGNSFLNLVDSEDLGPVVRGRSRSCPISAHVELSDAKDNIKEDVMTETQAPEEEVHKTMTEPLTSSRSVQQRVRNRGGLKNLPASCRPTSLQIVKECSNKSVVGPFDEEPVGASTATTRYSDPWGGSYDGSPTSPWPTTFDDDKIDEMASPTSPGGLSWADAWLEEQSEMSEAAPTSPTLIRMRDLRDLSTYQTEATVIEHSSKQVTSKDEIDPSVTTMMIQNLPDSVNQRELANSLDKNGFAGGYDFLYLPTDFGSGTSHGYAFVNFYVRGAPQKLMDLWDRQRPWGRTSMSKALRIMPAVLQGLDANVARWNSAKMRRVRNPDHRPMVMPGGMPEKENGEPLRDHKEGTVEGGVPASPTSPTSPGRQRKARLHYRR